MHVINLGLWNCVKGSFPVPTDSLATAIPKNNDGHPTPEQKRTPPNRG